MDFKKQTYSLQVNQYIRKLIQEGILKPGDPIKEQELSETLGISRAPIREALQVLVQEGLVSAEPQKGKTIRVLTAKEIRNGYSITAILEGEAIILSLDKWTDNDFEKLKKILATIKEKTNGASSISELTELDEQLHNTLLSHCDNKELISIARAYSANISKFLYFPYWSSTCTPTHFYERHEEVVNAMLTKNPEVIRQTIHQHYGEIATMVSAMVPQEND